MASFKEPPFQERVASADTAKQKALDQLKAKPKADPAVVAKRRQQAELKEQALADKRTAAARDRAVAKAERASNKAVELASAEAAAALKAARLKPATPEEMKAARDARYAARKARK